MYWCRFGTGLLSTVSSTTASAAEIQQNIPGPIFAMADVARRTQWYSNHAGPLTSPLPAWPTSKQQNKAEEQPGTTNSVVQPQTKQN